MFRATTFRLYKKDGATIEVCQTKLERKAILPDHLKKSYLYELTRRDVRNRAFQLPGRNNIPKSFSLLKEAAGKDWLSRLPLRHKDVLSLTKPMGTSFALALGFAKKI